MPRPMEHEGKNLWYQKLIKNFLRESYMDAFPIQLLLRFFFTSSVLLEENIYSRVTYTSITSDRKLVALSPEN